MRSSACLLPILLVAGCASTPEESIVWSTELARSLPRERGDVVEVARFSRSPPGAVGKPWEPYFVLRGNVPTAYRVVGVDGAAVLAADAEEGGSGLYRKIRIDLKRHPFLEWRWLVPPPDDSTPPLSVASRASPLYACRSPSMAIRRNSTSKIGPSCAWRRS